MSTKLTSRTAALMLAMAASAPLTLAGSIAAPATAEAGIVSGIKSAASKVGNAAKTTGKGFVGVGKAAGALGKQIGTGVATPIKRAAVAVGKQAVKVPPVKGVVNAVKAVRSQF